MCMCKKVKQKDQTIKSQNNKTLTNSKQVHCKVDDNEFS